MRMLATAISELDRLDDIVPDIQNMGGDTSFTASVLPWLGP